MSSFFGEGRTEKSQQDEERRDKDEEFHLTRLCAKLQRLNQERGRGVRRNDGISFQYVCRRATKRQVSRKSGNVPVARHGGSRM